MRKQTTYFVSGFPATAINTLLRLDIEHTEVKVHSVLWHKISRKHPEAARLVNEHIDATICQPEYVGQGPQHFENIELIRRTPLGILLIAVKIRDARGFYCRPIVASAYAINQITLTNRVGNKTIKRLK